MLRTRPVERGAGCNSRNGGKPLLRLRELAGRLSATVPRQRGQAVQHDTDPVTGSAH